jgi:hypothetical protein
MIMRIYNREVERSSVTGTELLDETIQVFEGRRMFWRGFAAGLESESLDRNTLSQTIDSPITLLSEMPAWEGSHRSRRHEQDFEYSIGAVVAAFALRDGRDYYELTEMADNLLEQIP